MSGLSVQSSFGGVVEFMASDPEWCPNESWLHHNHAPRSHVGVQERKEHLDLEHENLSLLLKVFPGVSLHSIAEAYTRAEGDPNYAAELLAWGGWGSPFPDVQPRAQGQAVQQKVSENGAYFETCNKPLESSFYYEKKSEHLEVEKQNIGSVKSQRVPGVHNHSGRPPEGDPCGPCELPEPFCQNGLDSTVINGSRLGCEGRNGNSVTRNFVSRGSAVGNAAGNGASNGTGSTLLGSGSSLLPGWKGFNHGSKMSAVSGTVSCHRQRRNGLSHHDTAKDSKDSRESGAVYCGKKKKKKGGMNANEESAKPVDSSEEQRAAEEFLHSMLGDGLELGLDVVRDVLEHFSGDTYKALDTLLHMASTSAGFHVNELCQEDCDEDSVQATSALLHKELVPRNNSLSTDLTQQSNFDVSASKSNEVDPHMYNICPWDEASNLLVLELVTSVSFTESFKHLKALNHDTLNTTLRALRGSSGRVEARTSLEALPHVLSKLHESFPTVELSFLSEVLQASDCSYGDAVQALKEAGMTPVNERVPSKVDPAELLHALFKTEPPDNTVCAGPFTEQKNHSGELYTVVAGRARVRRSAPCSKSVKANDEYEDHRGSANDHWSTMKRYFQEAAAAHSRGERALAGILSEKGQLFKGLARAASSRASEAIFNVKNRDIENNITIDLHAQHVHEAVRLLKLHLRSLFSISSVHTLTVITGHGSHSASGRARIKPALTQYLSKTNIPWVEPNAGCLIIKMSDVKAHIPAHYRRSDSSSSESQ